MVTSAVFDKIESLAASRREYVPGNSKVAVVTAADALPNVTVPGPLTFDHCVLSPPPLGRPSSLAEPDSVALFGSVMVSAGPALTTGFWLTGAGFTVTVRSALPERIESLTFRRTT